MKQLVFALFLITGAVASAFSQNQYEVSPDKEGGRIFKGILSREILENDTAFNRQWYAVNFKAYAPYKEAVDGLKKHADSIQIVAFMGTWCEDSHFIIPKLFHLLDEAGFPKNKVTLIGTDREKKTLGHLSEALNVTNVPTIIVMVKGREAGRVIEYGKTGSFDKDLAEILAAIK